eukprot:gene10014-13496_t
MCRVGRHHAGGGGGTGKKDRTLAVGTSAGPSAGAKGYLLTLGSDLGRRWTPNCLVEGGADVNIKVSFIVSSNGRLLADPTSSGSGAPVGSLTRAGSDAAIRAIRMTEPFPNFPPELFVADRRATMTIRAVLAALFALFMGVATLPGVARADIEIDVNQGDVRPMPIAVPGFTGGGRGAEMAQVITGNLERSGLFAPIDGAAFPERNLDIADVRTVMTEMGKAMMGTGE